jgi:hypothetical protein
VRSLLCPDRVSSLARGYNVLYDYAWCTIRTHKLLLSWSSRTQRTQEHFPDGKAAAEAVGRAAYDKGSLDNITVSCCVFEWQRERGRGVLRARREKQKQIAEQEEEIDMFG